MFSARKSGVPPTHPLLLRAWRIHISSGLKFVSKMLVRNDKVASIILFFIIMACSVYITCIYNGQHCFVCGLLHVIWTESILKNKKKECYYSWEREREREKCDRKSDVCSRSWSVSNRSNFGFVCEYVAYIKRGEQIEVS